LAIDIVSIVWLIFKDKSGKIKVSYAVKTIVETEWTCDYPVLWHGGLNYFTTNIHTQQLQPTSPEVGCIVNACLLRYTNTEFSPPCAVAAHNQCK